MAGGTYGYHRTFKNAKTEGKASVITFCAYKCLSSWLPEINPEDKHSFTSVN